jgi:hypothetical protein
VNCLAPSCPFIYHSYLTPPTSTSLALSNNPPAILDHLQTSPCISSPLLPWLFLSHLRRYATCCAETKWCMSLSTTSLSLSVKLSLTHRYQDFTGRKLSAGVATRDETNGTGDPLGGLIRCVGGVRGARGVALAFGGEHGEDGASTNSLCVT